MLYDVDASLTRDGQSTRDAEEVIATQMNQLRVAGPSARLADKQRLMHFVAEKVGGGRRKGRQGGREEREEGAGGGRTSSGYCDC